MINTKVVALDAENEQSEASVSTPEYLNELSVNDNLDLGTYELLADGIQFNINPSVTSTQGKLYWDADEKTLAVVLDSVSNVRQTIGTEIYVKAVNKTGSTILNGKAVYISGAQGNRPTIALAQANTLATCHIIGVTTQDIADNAEGFVTIIGDVHEINTSEFTAGDVLYLSATTPGAIINTAPSAPNCVVKIGTALDSTINGVINVNTSEPIATNLDGNSDLISVSQKAVKTAISTVEAKTYFANTMTVNYGTLTQGTVADLQALGGTDVIIQELTGANPLEVTFVIPNVSTLNSFAFYGDYSGGAMHQIQVEIYNVNSTNWDAIGIFGASTSKQWYSFPIFAPENYKNSGTVSVRLRHLGTGINTHSLVLDYLSLDYGGASGTTNTTASTITYVPSGSVSATNVQSAINELDSEKEPSLGNPDTDGKVLSSTTAGVRSWVAGVGRDFIGFSVGDGTNVITTGSKEKRLLPACTVLGWYIIANESGTIQIDIKKSTFANYPTNSSICASAKPSLSSQSKNSDTTLTGWTKTISENDVLEFIVDSATTVKKVQFFLKVQYAI